MGFLLDLVRRYSFAKRQTRFTRVVALISMFGMALGVMSLITVMSVMNGFAGELHGRILSLIPHGSIIASRGVIDDWVSVERLLQASPEVVGVSPYISETVLLQGWGRPKGGSLQGIDPKSEQTTTQLTNRIVRGDFSQINAPFSLVLGSGLARNLGVTVGDQVAVTLPKMAITPFGVFPRVKKLTVVAEFEVGAQLDGELGYVSLNTAQRLLGRTGVDGIKIQLADAQNSRRVWAGIEPKLAEGLSIRDWRDSQGSLFTAIAMEKFMIGLMLSVVIAVAAFNIISTLTMSVTEKRRDIAVLRVMGLSRQRVMMLFVGHGLYLGVLGIIAGAALGVALGLFIGDIATWFERATGVYLFDPSVYYIGKLPSELHWSDVIWTVGLALVLSLLATVYPAWRASKVPPAEVLNHV